MAGCRILGQGELRFDSPSFNHVKGHQDEDRDFNELSLPAQLNVEADCLAGHQSTTTLPAPVSPINHVQFRIRGKLITHKHKRCNMRC